MSSMVQIPYFSMLLAVIKFLAGHGQEE
jgi:hypothetical protein